MRLVFVAAFLALFAVLLVALYAWFNDVSALAAVVNMALIIVLVRLVTWIFPQLSERTGEE